jgi:hypothetical protein
MGTVGQFRPIAPFASLPTLSFNPAFRSLCRIRYTSLRQYRPCTNRFVLSTSPSFPSSPGLRLWTLLSRRASLRATSNATTQDRWRPLCQGVTAIQKHVTRYGWCSAFFAAHSSRSAGSCRPGTYTQTVKLCRPTARFATSPTWSYNQPLRNRCRAPSASWQGSRLFRSRGARNSSLCSPSSLGLRLRSLLTPKQFSLKNQ